MIQFDLSAKYFSEMCAYITTLKNRRLCGCGRDFCESNVNSLGFTANVSKLGEIWSIAYDDKKRQGYQRKLIVGNLSKQ